MTRATSWNVLTDTAMFDKLNHRLTSGTLPYGPRLVFIAIALINLPGALFGGFFFWTILPLPALVIYGFVVGLALGKSSVPTAKTISATAIFYHLILLGLLFHQFADTGGLGVGEMMFSRLALISYIAGPMGLYMLALRLLNDKYDKPIGKTAKAKGMREAIANYLQTP
ncbi:MAG: hypothetical protein AB8H47_07200 [Bacteroidia bacterium]